MNLSLRTLVLLVLVAVVAVPLSAADKPKKERKAKTPAASQMALGVVKGVTLTDEQRQKIKDIGAQFADRLTEAKKKVAEAVSPELKKARAEAAKQAREAGKKGKEVKEAIEAAASLTDEQKAAVQTAQAELKQLGSEMRDAVLAVLTDEQKAELPKKEAKKGKKAKAQ